MKTGGEHNFIAGALEWTKHKSPMKTQPSLNKRANGTTE
jgi:hypothetical protein